MNHPFFNQRALRRERRLASFQGLGEALRHEASGWDLQERLNGDAFGKPSTLPETIKKAVATVRDTLDQLGEFPIPPTIEYQSIRSVRAAAGGTEQTPLIADGVILLSARFLTKTGVRDSFDVPVLIREGQVLPPSVIMHDGTMKVLAPSSVREMVARGTFTQQAPSRGPYSGPLSHEEVTQWNQIERDFKTQPRLNPGMFSVNGAAAWLVRAAVQGEAQFNRASMEHAAQLGDQPSRASMGFEASPGSRIGDRIVSMVTWDPDRVESMSDGNLHHAIRSFVLELGTKKEWRDWGTIADVQVDEFDRGEGSARVSFKSSEISAPQLSAADFEDLSKSGSRTAAAMLEPGKFYQAGNQFVKVIGPAASGYAASQGAVDAELVSHPYDPTHKVLIFARDFDAWNEVPESMVPRTASTHEAAFCEKCQVNHRSTTKCPYADGGEPKAKTPKAPKPPKAKKTNLSPKGDEILSKQPKPDAPAHEHMSWALDHIGDAIDEAQSAYRLDGMLRRSPGAVTRASDQLVTKLMDAYQGAVSDLHGKIRNMPEGKERDRAEQIFKMIGSQFSFGGRGLDRQRDPEKTRRIMQRVKPLYDEAVKLTGGQMQMFARRTAAIGPSQDETHLQPAERDKETQFHVGEEVKLTKGQLLRNRGGGVDTVPKGTKGKVVGDMFGDGLTLKIVFEEVSSQPMIIPASHVKHASSVTAAKVLTEIANLRRAGYSPIDVILTARQRYGALGEEALHQAKEKGLLDW